MTNAARCIGVASAIAWAAVDLPAQPRRDAPACYAGPIVAPVPVPFSTFATLRRRYVLPDDGASAVLSVRSLAFTPTGQVLITDGRNKRVLEFDADFVRARLIGREGAGPGEYRLPRQAVVAKDGSIIVLDAQLTRTVTFSATGESKSAQQTPTVDARTLLPLADGGLLFGGMTRSRGQEMLLTRSTSTGGVSWIAVPADTIVTALRLIVDGVWMSPGIAGDVFVGLQVAPRVFRVRLDDGAVLCRAQIPTSAWRQLLPERRPQRETLASIREWIETATVIASSAVLETGELVLTISSGKRGEEVYDWIVFDAALRAKTLVGEAPGRLVATHAGELFVVGEDNEGRSVISRFVIANRK